MANNQTSARRDGGQELIEFALVVPLLLLVVFAVLDLGRLFHAAITIENAARVGARYGSRNPGEDIDIRAEACGEALDSGLTLNCGNISVSYPDGSSNSGHPVRVTVSYDFDLIFGEILLYFGEKFSMLDFTMTRSAEMLIP